MMRNDSGFGLSLGWVDLDPNLFIFLGLNSRSIESKKIRSRFRLRPCGTSLRFRSFFEIKRSVPKEIFIF